MDHLEMKQMVFPLGLLEAEVWASTDACLLVDEAEARILKLESGVRALMVAAAYRLDGSRLVYSNASLCGVRNGQ